MDVLKLSETRMDSVQVRPESVTCYIIIQEYGIYIKLRTTVIFAVRNTVSNSGCK